jgi:hypothetical protein
MYANAEKPKKKKTNDLYGNRLTGTKPPVLPFAVPRNLGDLVTELLQLELAKTENKKAAKKLKNELPAIETENNALASYRFAKIFL